MMTHHFLSQELNFYSPTLPGPNWEHPLESREGVMDCATLIFFFFCWSQQKKIQQKNATLCHNLGIISDKNVTSVIIRLLPFLTDWSFSEFFQRGIPH